MTVHVGILIYEAVGQEPGVQRNLQQHIVKPQLPYWTDIGAL